MKHIFLSYVFSITFAYSVNALADGSSGGGGVSTAVEVSAQALPSSGMSFSQAQNICQPFDQAFASNNTTALSELIADGAKHVNPCGALLAKAVFLDKMKVGKIRFNTYKTKTIDYVEQIGMTLVIGGVLETSATCNGKALTGQFRFVRILVPSNEMLWQEVYSQLTPLASSTKPSTIVRTPDYANFINLAGK